MLDESSDDEMDETGVVGPDKKLTSRQKTALKRKAEQDLREREV